MYGRVPLEFHYQILLQLYIERVDQLLYIDKTSSVLFRYPMNKCALLMAVVHFARAYHHTHTTPLWSKKTNEIHIIFFFISLIVCRKETGSIPPSEKFDGDSPRSIKSVQTCLYNRFHNVHPN